MAALGFFGARDRKAVKNLPNRAYYRSLIDFKQEACLLVDMEGDILMVNAPFTKLTGFAEDDLAGLPLKAFALKMHGAPNPLHQNVLREFEEEFLFIGAEGSLMPLLLNFKEIEGQKFLTILHPSNSVNDNVSAKTTVEQKTEPLLSVTKVQTEDKTTFEPLKLMQNENLLSFRTAVSGLEGVLQILKGEQNVQFQQKHLDAALRALERIKEIAGMGEGAQAPESQQVRLEPVEVSKLLSWVIAKHNLLARDMGVELSTETEPSLYAVTDERILKDTIDWLVEKALRFTRNERVFIKAGAVEGKVKFSVDNLGLELSPELARLMAEAKTRPGAEIIQRIAHFDARLGKVFSASIKVGIEWDFELKLPAGMIVTLSIQGSTDSGKEAAIMKLVNQLKPKNLRVMVVEDDRLNAKILEQFLKEAAEVIVAHSGNEALNYLSYLLAERKIDVIFMDFNLPAPWNGAELMQEMKKRHPETHQTIFIAQTADSNKEVVEQMFSSGFRDVLTKPIDRLHLLKTLDQFVK